MEEVRHAARSSPLPAHMSDEPAHKRPSGGLTAALHAPDPTRAPRSRGLAVTDSRRRATFDPRRSTTTPEVPWVSVHNISSRARAQGRTSKQVDEQPWKRSFAPLVRTRLLSPFVGTATETSGARAL